MAPWLFTVGLSLEIVGASLIAWPLLSPILRRRWSVLAAKGWLFPRGGPHEKDMEEHVHSLMGVSLLVTGFVVQLAGYIVAYADGWLVLAASGVLVGGFGGGFLAAPRLAKWLLSKAREHDETAKAEAARARNTAT